MNLQKDQVCPHCGRFDDRASTIDAVIIREGKVVLIKRGSEPDKGKWGTPGGYIAWNETLEDCVRREVKEETGLKVKDLKFVGVYSDPKRHPKQTINHVYLAWVENGDINHGDDAEEADWFEQTTKRFGF